MQGRWPTLAAIVWTSALLGSCGGSAAPAATGPHAQVAMVASPDWPEFGGNPQRSNSSDAQTGITATNVSGLTRHRIHLPGTVDSSPIYLHGVSAAGAMRDLFVVTTSYGRTLALDASDGRILWQFVPPGISAWEGSFRITNASPAADPDRRHVFAASPDGRIHRLALSDGHETTGWPVSVTRDPRHEKLGASLNVTGRRLLVATGGYFGDAPPYQGHVVELSTTTGRVLRVFNTLCADHHHLMNPTSCGASDSAIWSRAGMLVEPSGRLLLATGNGPYDGRTNFGDSVLELDSRLRLRQAFTPVNQAQLSSSDTDLGSGGPALLPESLALIGGKDGQLRVLDLRRLNGRAIGRPFRTGGELQVLSSPGGQPLYSQPAVWHNMVFVSDQSGTAAYRVANRRLSLAWRNGTHGTSPVLAGGLLYVYDLDGGALNVYRPGSGARLASLPAGGGHWSSPVIAGGRVALPEGNANDNSTSGVLNLYY
jgi:outer membrane protein assembly factor BamB